MKTESLGNVLLIIGLISGSSLGTLIVFRQLIADKKTPFETLFIKAIVLNLGIFTLIMSVHMSSAFWGSGVITIGTDSERIPRFPWPPPHASAFSQIYFPT